MKNFVKLKVNREGQYTVKNVENFQSQCGHVGQREYKYFVTVEANNKKLNNDGFIIDNDYIDKYFKTKYHKKEMPWESCEVMVCKALDYFVTAFKREPELKKIDLQRVYVRVHGSSFSFIEGEWFKK